MGKHDRGTPPKKGRQKLPQQQPAERSDPSAGHPKFCLRFLQSGFDVQNLPKERRADFALALQQRAQCDWNTLIRSGKHGQGYEYLPRSVFRGPIPAAFEDAERFMVFRYSDNLPMAGIRANDTFHIVWIEKWYGDLYNHGS